MKDIAEVKLRAVEPEDVDCLYRWENDPGNWLTSVSIAPMSRFQLWEYARKYDANPFANRQLTLIIMADEQAVGYVELYDISARDGRGMVGIYIAPEHRRKGYGEQSLQRLRQYCGESLGMRMLGAETAADNHSATALFLKAGFKQTGLRPRWYRRGESTVDAILFQREEVGNHES